MSHRAPYKTRSISALGFRLVGVRLTLTIYALSFGRTRHIGFGSVPKGLLASTSELLPFHGLGEAPPDLIAYLFRKPRPGPPRPLAPQRGPGLIRLHLVNLRAKSCVKSESLSCAFPGGHLPLLFDFLADRK